jgi:hypothetical protein
LSRTLYASAVAPIADETIASKKTAFASERP